MVRRNTKDNEKDKETDGYDDRWEAMLRTERTKSWLHLMGHLS